MATLALFDDMLNEHLAYDLLMEELTERNWLIKNVEKNQKWKGGALVVPFRGARGSSFSQGSLTSENDISDYSFVRGQVDDYKETWGTLKFNAKDLHQHVPERRAQEGSRQQGLVPPDPSGSDRRLRRRHEGHGLDHAPQRRPLRHFDVERYGERRLHGR